MLRPTWAHFAGFALQDTNDTEQGLATGWGVSTLKAVRSGLFYLPAIVAFGLAFTTAQADPVVPGPLPTPPPVAPETPPSPHLTDDQDRLMSGALHPSAEALSRANALYAEAMQDDSSHPQETIAKLHQVVDLDPHFVDAQVKLSKLLLDTGQIDAALAQILLATAANPDSAPIEAALGNVRRMRGENAEAFRPSAEALTHDPTQVSAIRVMLEIAGNHDDLAHGVSQVEDILKADGHRVPAATWLALAKTYVDVARSDVHSPTNDEMLHTLLFIYQQAAAKTPPEASTLVLLADTYRDLGQRENALETLHQAAALEPSNVDVLLRCAELEMMLGQTAKAVLNYRAAYDLNPNLTGLRSTLIRSYLGLKQFADAIPLLQQAVTESPNDLDAEINLGFAYEEAKQPDKAAACFKQLLASPVCPPEGYQQLAMHQLQNKQIKEAGETMAAALARFPQSAQVSFYAAVQYRYAKNYDAALAALAHTRTLAEASGAGSLDENYYLESAMTLHEGGRLNLIESILREGLSKYPNSPDLMNELAYFWAEAGTHLPDALTLSTKAIALAPSDGPILDTRGWVSFQMGQAKDALPYLQRAAVLTNNDPVVLQHLGDAYLKLGRRRDAIASWRQALERDPGNSDLASRIDAATAQAPHAHPRSAPTP
jgi:tetratricopeptide (TPR) repeat protein